VGGVGRAGVCLVGVVAVPAPEVARG
jgi:hypothetical protein